MEKVIKIFNSFEEQEEEEKKYWQNLSGEKKIGNIRIYSFAILGHE